MEIRLQLVLGQYKKSNMKLKKTAAEALIRSRRPDSIGRVAATFAVAARRCSSRSASSSGMCRAAASSVAVGRAWPGGRASATGQRSTSYRSASPSATTSGCGWLAVRSAAPADAVRRGVDVPRRPPGRQGGSGPGPGGYRGGGRAGGAEPLGLRRHSGSRRTAACQPALRSPTQGVVMRGRTALHDLRSTR